MASSTAMGSWVVGRFQRVLPVLGLLHLISMPLQLMYVSRLPQVQGLYASGSPSEIASAEGIKLLVALLQLALLPGGRVPDTHKGFVGAAGVSVWEHGWFYSWLLVVINYLIWICTMFQESTCGAHPCSSCPYVIPSSLSWLMVGSHYVFACLWLGMAVGPSPPVGSPVLANLQCFVTWLFWGCWGAPRSVASGTKFLWSALLPMCWWVGPYLIFLNVVAEGRVVVACVRVPSKLQSACTALQACSHGPEIAATGISALVALLFCITKYVQRMCEHRAQLWAAVVSQVVGFKLQFIRCIESALRLLMLLMQLGGLTPLLKSWFVSVKHRLIMFFNSWPVSHGTGRPVHPPSCEGSTAANRACPAEDSRGGPGVRHAQREQQTASGFVSQRDEALKAEAQEAIMECIVCQDAVRSVALKPCGHLACCEACFARMQKDAAQSACCSGRRAGPGLKCPVCRADVQGYVARIIL